MAVPVSKSRVRPSAMLKFVGVVGAARCAVCQCAAWGGGAQGVADAAACM